MTPSNQDRAAGMFLGLASGDALGTTLEFEQYGTFEPITDIVGGGPFDLPVGYWTDDTSMALCLADSLLEQNGYDPYDVMSRYLAWYKQGYRSSTGVCFDIGGQTAMSLNTFEASSSGIIPADAPRSTSAGNGSIMRLAPIVIAGFYQRHIGDILRLAQVSARETHYSIEAEAGTEVFAALLCNAMNGADKAAITNIRQFSTGTAFDEVVADVDIDAIPLLRPSDIDSSGYVVAGIRAALWGFLQYDSFESGALAVVNLGGDADTNGAIYGQLAGAYYGLDAIPESWRQKVLLHDEIVELSHRLLAMPDVPILASRFAEDSE